VSCPSSMTYVTAISKSHVTVRGFRLTYQKIWKTAPQLQVGTVIHWALVLL
jgi:hypothetical protein